MAICPCCQGQKGSICFVDGVKDGKRFGETRWEDCRICNGAGELPDEIANDLIVRRERGRKLRDKRVKGSVYFNQRQMADKCGVDVVTLSQMEHGDVPIPADVWRAYGLEPEQDDPA